MSVLSSEQVLTPSRPVLALLPVPVCEPPYDDELPPAAASGGQPRTSPVGPLRALVPLRLVPTPGEGAAPAPVSGGGRDLPPAAPFARALVQGLLEVLAGVRPVTQLRRSTSDELFAELESRVHAQARPTGRRPQSGAVRSVHVQDRDAVAEVCVTVARGSRAAAVALRLEGLDGRWRCTALAGLDS